MYISVWQNTRPNKYIVIGKGRKNVQTYWQKLPKSSADKRGCMDS
jgi:hypothetical protein